MLQGWDTVADRWTEAHVRRLFWRAGFGASTKEARYWAKRSKGETVHWLLRGGPGPKISLAAPRVDGKPLDPVNEYGHDVLWWLDKMVRTPRPLQEKMTLFWHDHFATLDQDRPLMLAQNKMFRKYGMGSYRKLLQRTTKDPAMLFFLSLANSSKDEPNENYARELMELFTLGTGYTERDIREAAKAMTGFRSTRNGGREVTFYDAKAHNRSETTIFGKKGAHDWKDVLDLCIAHPKHAPFLVSKLYEFFHGEEPGRGTRTELARTYKRSRHQIRPVLKLILEHPNLYRSLSEPDMVKSPVVLVAGQLRASRTPITRGDYVNLLDGMGQRLFSPPSVAGWDGGLAWLSTYSMHVRWDFANSLLDDRLEVRDKAMPPNITAKESLSRAKSVTGRPWISPQTERKLLQLAKRQLAPRSADIRERQQAADMTQRMLRHLLIAGPDNQVH